MYTAIVFLNPFNVSITNETYEKENVVATVEWSQDCTSVISSTITVFPHTEVNEGFQNAQLTVDYNILYTVNITKHLCGENFTETIELHYGVCIHELYSLVYYCYTYLQYTQSDAMSVHFMPS